jgi:DNA-binding beta-propeller fold protein YncE
VKEKLVVALGERRYRVERPWGAVPKDARLTAVTVDGAGRIYALTRGDPYLAAHDDPVLVLDGEGKLLGRFGGSRIFDPHMIACDAQQRIWVVDRDAHEIIAFDASGRELATLGKRHHPLEPFNHPTDIAFAPDGSILVSDGYAGARIHRFAPDLTPRASWGSVGRAPGAFLTAHSVWAMQNGNVVVADRENQRLQVFTEDGALLAVWDGFHRPSDLWGDAQGRLYVVDGIPTLTCLAQDGAVLGRCRPVLNSAHGIWGDAQGRLYLAENNPSRMTRLEPISS